MAGLSTTLSKITGATSLIRTLAAGGVKVWFSNPGTSEIHFVAAMDRTDDIRPILCLFEGVATGAADGYGRLTGKPAATLLHLGPGFGNSLAGLHNAAKAGSPVINVVGEHASYHLGKQAPLELLRGSINDIATPVSGWVHRVTSPESISSSAAQALKESLALPGRVSTLICPADFSWSLTDSKLASIPKDLNQKEKIDQKSVLKAAQILKEYGNRAAILLGGPRLLQKPLEVAGRIATKTKCTLLNGYWKSRLQRGHGRVVLQRIPYYVEDIITELKNIDYLILCGASEPVAFFAYPNRPERLLSSTCQMHTLATESQDVASSLEALSDALNCDSSIDQKLLAKRARYQDLNGKLNLEGVARTVANLIPDETIISAEANSSSGPLEDLLATGPPHDWLFAPMGGSIGQGIPLSVGAAVACPSRKVLTLEGDGSAMYTIQGLWTQARENLDVTTVILNNHRYAILDVELSRVFEGQKSKPKTGPIADSQLSLGRPTIDFVKVAQGLGVEASRATTHEEFRSMFASAMQHKGPRLIEACIF